MALKKICYTIGPTKQCVESQNTVKSHTENIKKYSTATETYSKNKLHYDRPKYIITSSG